MNVAAQTLESKTLESQQSSGPQSTPQQPTLPGQAGQPQIEYYFTVPNRLVDAAPDKILPFDHAVYNTLKRNRLPKSRTVQLRIRFIARSLGVGRRMVERSLARLEAARCIARVSGKAKGESDVFWFPEVWGGASPQTQGCVSPDAGVRLPRRRGASVQTHKKQIGVKEGNGEDCQANAVEVPSSSSSCKGEDATTTTTKNEVPELLIEELTARPMNELGEEFGRRDCAELWFPVHAFDARVKPARIIEVIGRLTKELHFKRKKPMALIPYLKTSLWNYFGVPDELRPGTARRRDVRWER